MGCYVYNDIDSIIKSLKRSIMNSGIATEIQLIWLVELVVAISFKYNETWANGKVNKPVMVSTRKVDVPNNFLETWILLLDYRNKVVHCGLEHAEDLLAEIYEHYQLFMEFALRYDIVIDWNNRAMKHLKCEL